MQASAQSVEYRGRITGVGEIRTVVLLGYFLSVPYVWIALNYCTE